MSHTMPPAVGRRSALAGWHGRRRSRRPAGAGRTGSSGGGASSEGVPGRSHAFGVVQRLGTSLMLPVAVLPVAGILLGVGGAFIGGLQQKARALGFCVLDGVVASCDQAQALGDPVAAGVVSRPVLVLLQVLQGSGRPVFDALPLVFAIGVALGLARNDGVSALAATIGYLVMNGTLGVVATARGIPTIPVLGQETLRTGVVGGIAVGIVAGVLFNRFHRIALPPCLGFFAGKRFVPIVTGLASMVLGLVLVFVWPPVGDLIDGGANSLVRANTPVTVTVYGLVERALVPLGLHHIWNAPFFYTVNVGGWPDCQGILPCFFRGHAESGVLGGGFLFKMFGLPGAGCAIWRAARPEHRLRVGSIMFSAALTSFLTGITEPLEFSFLAAAPILFVAHLILAGLAFPIMYLAGGRLGYTFSQGAIDFGLFSANGTRPWLVLLLGPLYFVLYYAVFTWLIRWRHLRTPGREGPGPGGVDVRGATDIRGATDVHGEVADPSARRVVLALGGRSNIRGVDACITRLRVEVHDVGRACPEQLRALGAVGVLQVGNSIQAVFGTRSENLRTAVEEYLRHAEDESADAEPSEAGPGAATTGAAETGTAEVRAAGTNGVFLRDTGLRPRQRDPLAPQKVDAWLAALGGAANLVSVEATAATRLRVVVRDDREVDVAGLEAAQVSAVVRVGEGTWHLLVGLAAGQYAAEARIRMTRAVR